MKYIKFTRNLTVSLLLSTLLFLQGCLRDRPDENMRPDDKIQEEGLVVNISVPGMQAVTRSGFSENEIRELDVLVFDWIDNAGNPKEKFVERIKGKIIATGLGGGRITQFYVPLPQKSDFSLVVVANARAELDNVMGSSPTYKTDIENRFELGQGPGDVAWNQSQDPPAALPMWGETGRIAAMPSANEALEVEMMRMHARIDVEMNDTASDLNALQLNNFYNYGCLYSPTTGSFEPKLPIGMGVAVRNYNYVPQAVPFRSVNGELYVYEAGKASDANYTTSPHLLVQAKYSGTYYWYRINLTWDGSIGGTVKGAYMPVLRNFRYTVSVNKVNGPGYSTPEEASAALGESNNLSVSILTENERAGNIVYDGNYYLSVDKTEFTASKSGIMSAPYYEVTVRTNYATSQTEGWTVTASDAGITASGKQSMTSFSGAALADGKVRFTVEPNPGSTDRVLAFTIGAGKLSQEIKINQTGTAVTASIDATVIPGEMIFRSWNGVLMEDYKYQMFLQWASLNGVSIESIVETPPSGTEFKPFVFSSGAGFDNLATPVRYTGTQKLLNIGAAPVVNDTYSYPLRSLIRIEANGDNGTVIKEIPVRHKNFYVTCPKSGIYVAADNISQTISLNTNTKFTMTVDPDNGDPKGLLSSAPPMYGSITQERYNNPLDHSWGSGYGLNIWFHTKEVDDIGATPSQARFKISSKPYAEYPDEIVQYFSIDVVPIAQRANSYIVKPGMYAPAIPVSQANQSAELGSSWLLPHSTMTAVVEWSDTPGVIAGTPEFRYATESTSESYMLVKAGNPGNAVVSVKQGGVTKWSWHIWVTDDKDIIEAGAGLSKKWMDRNLGAKTNTYSASNPRDVYGLRYIWGRKDPFPIEDSFYKGGTTHTNYGNAMLVSGNILSTLQPTIAAPLTLGTEGWRGSNGVDSWFLLDDSYKRVKTVYDPCPPGWIMPTVTDQSEIDFAGASFTSTGATTPSGLFWPYGGSRSAGPTSSPYVENLWTEYGRYLSSDADYTPGDTKLFPPGFRVSMNEGVVFTGADINRQYSARCLRED